MRGLISDYLHTIDFNASSSLNVIRFCLPPDVAPQADHVRRDEHATAPARLAGPRVRERGEDVRRQHRSRRAGPRLPGRVGREEVRAPDIRALGRTHDEAVVGRLRAACLLPRRLHRKSRHPRGGRREAAREV